MNTIIRDLERPKLISHGPMSQQYRIRSGYVGEKPFEFWYRAKDVIHALKCADEAWEAHKKTLYGPNTHVETVRLDTDVLQADKYRSPE